MAVKREERVHLTRPAVRGSAAPSSGDHVGQVAEVGAPARWSARAPGRTVEIVEFRPEQARHPAVVLVHGAYADGSSWSEVIERLQGAGVPVTAVQNPLSSLADDVAHTRRILALAAGHAVQGRVSEALFQDRATVAAWRSKPSWYAISRQDRTISPDLQRFLAGRMGATTIEIDSGHLSLITHPQEVTQLIMNAVDAARRLT